MGRVLRRCSFLWIPAEGGAGMKLDLGYVPVYSWVRICQYLLCRGCVLICTELWCQCSLLPKKRNHTDRRMLLHLVAWVKFGNFWQQHQLKQQHFIWSKKTQTAGETQWFRDHLMGLRGGFHFGSIPCITIGECLIPQCHWPSAYAVVVSLTELLQQFVLRFRSAVSRVSIWFKSLELTNKISH